MAVNAQKVTRDGGSQPVTHRLTFCFVGAAQFVLAMIIAEARYPGYSIAKNAISDLGVGRTARLFNASIIVFGAAIVGGALIGTGFLAPCRRFIVLGAPGSLVWGYSLRRPEGSISAARSSRSFSGAYLRSAPFRTRERPSGVLLNRTRGHFARCVSAVDPEAHARHRLRRDGAIGRLPDHPMGTRPRRVSAQHSLRSASAERERNVAHLVLARLIVIQPRLGSSAEAGQRSV